MSFYSNNLAKNTIGGAQSGFNFNKGKENMSPLAHCKGGDG